MDWIGEWKGKECGGIVRFRCGRSRGDGGFLNGIMGVWYCDT